MIVLLRMCDSGAGFLCVYVRGTPLVSQYEVQIRHVIYASLIQGSQ
jgi:hypothetical protein